MIPITTLALLASLGEAAPALLQAAENLDADVPPQISSFAFAPSNPDGLYYHMDPKNGKKDWAHFEKDADSTWYPYFKDGEIHPPLKYHVEERYSQDDLHKIKLALIVAHRYANVNNAFEDGYRLEDFFDAGMGIHMTNVDYVVRGYVSVEKPQFLTYVFNRNTKRLQLLQLGYIHPGKQRIKLFDTKEAQGHFHIDYGRMCIHDNIFHYFFDPPPSQAIYPPDPCGSEGFYRVGPIWMMHFAVNLYNEEGMFSDDFQYGDYLSSTATAYSFYGKRMP